MFAEFGKAARDGREDLVTMICACLRERQWRLGTAESCTGGGIAYLITGTAGVSDVFAGGIIAYSNELKVQLLGVSERTLEAHGAVSEPAAREMLCGLLERYGLQAGIAVSGIAGPTGGTPDKPVGTVHIATAAGADIRHARHVFAYGRRGMRERTAHAALNQLWRQLLEQG